MTDGLRNLRPVGGTAWTSELWGGLAAMLVALPSSVAYGVLVYSALGPVAAGQGALIGAAGAAAIGIVAPLVGRSRGLISAPCAPAAAVLAAFAADLVARSAGMGMDAAHIPLAIGLTGLIAALLQILYGAIGAGRLIKFIPYQVVSGYMTGVGTLIALAQLPKLFGLAKDTTLVFGLVSPDLWQWQGLIVGIATIAAMVAAPRLFKRIPAAIVGLAAGSLAYGALAFADPRLQTLQGNALVIGPLYFSGSLTETVSSRTAAMLNLSDFPLELILLQALTLSVLLSIDTLKTCVVLDATIRGRHNSNRELIAQGAGNLAAFFAGGMPGAGTMGPTLVNVSSGGRTFRSAVLEGVLVVLAIALAGHALAWLPVGALAGILIMVAWRMVDKSMFRLLRYPAGRLDFVVIAGVVLVAVAVDLIAAAGIGVVFAILLFIHAQMRGSVIRHKQNLTAVSSKTRRLAPEREALRQRGDSAVFCELQGDLFFGTTDQLLTLLEADLRTARYILLDMRRVQSMDYTGAHLLGQLQSQLEDHGGRLLFSGMPSARVDERDFERDLVRLGVIGEPNGAIVFDTLDEALEWMEQRILESAGFVETSVETPLAVGDIALFRDLDDALLKDIAVCLEERAVTAGQKIVAAGEPGDEMFFVRRGRVQALLPLEGGKRHHLATFGPGDFFGEFTFLDRRERSADVVAKVPTDLYALSRARFDALTGNLRAGLAEQLFARLALAIAERLRHADAELRLLESR